MSQSNRPLTAADLRTLRCSKDGCEEPHDADQPLHADQRCHRGAAQRAVVLPEQAVVVLLCDVCGETVSAFRVADVPTPGHRAGKHIAERAVGYGSVLACLVVAVNHDGSLTMDSVVADGFEDVDRFRSMVASVTDAVEQHHDTQGRPLRMLDNSDNVDPRRDPPAKLELEP